MEMAVTIFFQLVALLIMAAAGWAMVRTGKLTDEGPLNATLTNVALPALVIANLQTPFSAELLRDMGITLVGMCAVLAASCLVGYLSALLFRKKGRKGGAWIASISFPNAVFVGQPLMVTLYSESILVLIAPIVLVFNLSAFILGAWLVSWGSQEGGKGVSITALLRKPPVLSCFIGLILYFMPFRLPAPALSSIQMLASMTTPLSMVIIGCQLARCSLKELFLDKDNYLATFFRLVPAAVAGALAARIFVSDPVILGILTIAACMPGAAVIPVLAKERGGDAVFCSKVTFTSTVFCVLTAPILLAFLLSR